MRSIAAGRGVLYAGTQPPRVHASPDGGKSWRPLTRFPRARSWWWVQPAERPYRPSYVSALAVTPSGTIVAGIEACAVLRSDDGGRSWSGHRPGALRDCHELHVADGRVYEAGSGGVAFSDDDGRSWQRHRAGLDRRYGWSMAVAGETLYLTAARYLTAHSGNSQARIFRNRRGHAWEGCTSELGSLPRLGATADGAAFAAFSDGTLLRSPCEGQRWEPVCRELGGPSSALVAMRAEPANI